MKRKTLTLVLCLLTVMSLVGVGFASWVISADASQTVTGDIIVDTVTDERYNLSVGPVTANDIIFAAPQTKSTYQNAWLTQKFEDGVDAIYENLTVTYPCTLTKKDGSTFTANVDVVNEVYYNVVFNEPAVETGEEGAKVDTSYKNAKDLKVIELYNNTGYQIKNVQIASDYKSVTFDLVVGYSWGELFDVDGSNLNPFDYYNNGKDPNASSNVNIDNTEGNESWGDHALYVLNLLSSIDAAAEYGVTITVSKNSSTGSQLKLGDN